jgi:REP element-mobilizing transposase RayT
VVFSTRNRLPKITEDAAKPVYKFMNQCLKELNCLPVITNGTENHIHHLFHMDPNTCISEIIKIIKGKTSHWINREQVIPGKFTWQVGYSAFSVSDSQIDEVKKYIADQKYHHQKISLVEELRQLTKLKRIPESPAIAVTAGLD